MRMKTLAYMMDMGDDNWIAFPLLYYDGSILTNVESEPPQARKILVEVPGRDGYIDLSGVLNNGYPSYGNGKITFSFTKTREMASTCILALFVAQDIASGASEETEITWDAIERMRETARLEGTGLEDLHMHDFKYYANFDFTYEECDWEDMGSFCLIDDLWDGDVLAFYNDLLQTEMNMELTERMQEAWDMGIANVIGDVDYPPKCSMKIKEIGKNFINFDIILEGVDVRL